MRNCIGDATGDARLLILLPHGNTVMLSPNVPYSTDNRRNGSSALSAGQCSLLIGQVLTGIFLKKETGRRVSFTGHIPQVTGTGHSNCAPKRNMFLLKINIRACLVLLALLRLLLCCFGANTE